jgi:hypothetical protein
MLAPPPRAGDSRKSAGVDKVIVPEEDTRGHKRSRSEKREMHSLFAGNLSQNPQNCVFCV